MRKYIHNVGTCIPTILSNLATNPNPKDTFDLHFYGFYEETGFRGFWRKVKLGLKLYINARSTD